jgi:hypothetical protein
VVTRLTLRKEALAALTDGDLAAVGSAGQETVPCVSGAYCAAVWAVTDKLRTVGGPCTPSQGGC